MDATYINSKPLLEPVQTDERYQQNLKNFLLQKPDSNTLNNSSFMPWSSTIQQTQPNFVDVLGSELDMATLIDQPVWPLGQFNSQAPNVNDSFDAFNNLFAPWSSNMQVPPTIKEEWGTNNIPLGLPSQAQEHIPIQSIPFQQQHQQQFMFPPTPPVSSPGSYVGQHYIEAGMNKGLEFNSDYPIQFTREPTPPPSSSNSGNNSPNSAISTPPMSYYAPSKITHQRATMRRRSTESHHPTPTRSYRRRASSHPSVASVVSLTAHEPVARVIDGIEYITFLYSHERLVKEYTVRTDIENVSLESIPIGFRVQNAIYPRANVSREDYDGNRWEYETSCNKLGWQLCWLNQDQLSGRRGLIQRAVDSYRNRHAEMRSRRVTRQEKVANGTLRKRRAKKSHSALL